MTFTRPWPTGSCWPPPPAWSRLWPDGAGHQRSYRRVSPRLLGSRPADRGDATVSVRCLPRSGGCDGRLPARRIDAWPGFMTRSSPAAVPAVAPKRAPSRHGVSRAWLLVSQPGLLLGHQRRRQITGSHHQTIHLNGRNSHGRRNSPGRSCYLIGAAVQPRWPTRASRYPNA